MTNSVPPDPNDSRRDNINLGSDEWIAILVAFPVIGAILFWSFNAAERSGFNWQTWQEKYLSSQIAEESESLSDRERIFSRLEDEDEAVILIPSRETELEEFVSPQTPSALITQPTGRISRRNFGLYGSPLYETPAAIPSETLLEDPVLPPTTTEPVIPEVTETPETEIETPVIPEAEVPEAEAEIEETETPETEIEETETLVFRDVPETYWAYPFIAALAEKERINGLGNNTFQPDKFITRAEMANLISQAFEGEQTAAPKNFEDVDRNNLETEDINEAVGLGFMEGYSDEIFRPAENIPRYQVLVSLASGLGLEPTTDPTQVLAEFSDRDEIPNWAIAQVAAAVESGLLVNRPEFESGALNPNRAATRAEVAAMIYQALVESEEVEPISSEYIVPTP